MNLQDLFEADNRAAAALNTARAIAAEMFADMSDLVDIQQAAAATGPGNPNYRLDLVSNVQRLAGELAKLGYEFDFNTPGHVRPLTIDMPTHQPQLSEMTCEQCGGPAFSDLLLAEKQDACYRKVKSRYKVWPSAYASGALVQCRKKGAANWGNKG